MCCIEMPIANDFIALQSYSKKRAFIAAQCPMEHTRNDIWDLIWQFKAFTVVLLCDFLEGNQVCTCSIVVYVLLYRSCDTC